MTPTTRPYLTPGKGAIALLTAFVLGACAGNPVTPPPVEDAAPIERDVAESVPEPPPPANAATQSLVLAAATASDKADHESAIVYLERAVRIDPRNSELWRNLAAEHLATGNLVSATQHARKALALAGQDQTAVRLAWLQLADIKQAEGNVSEAKSIRRRWGRVPT